MLWILVLVQVLEEIYHSFLKNKGHWTFESWMIWASLMNVPVTVIFADAPGTSCNSAGLRQYQKQLLSICLSIPGFRVT